MGWPKKMWGRKPTPKIKPEKPEFEDMSLFTDTLRKLEEKEAELAVAHDRIRNLEIALTAARRDRLKAVENRGGPYGHKNVGFSGKPDHDLNSLSEDDVKELFKSHEESKIDDQVEAYRNTDDDEKPVKRGFLSPLVRLCALVKR